MFETAMLLELLEKLRDKCHQNSKDKGFWDKEDWNFGEKVALIHTELSEMFEWYRKGLKNSEKDIQIVDCGITRRITGIEEEMADVFIRLLDLCGKLNIDVGRVILAKMEYNSTRPYMHGGRKC